MEAVHIGENRIIQSTFHKNKKPIIINEVNIKGMALSDKYFIGYRHKGNAFPSPLCINLPQRNVCAKYFDKNSKYINHLVKDEKILKKYLKI